MRVGIVSPSIEVAENKLRDLADNFDRKIIKRFVSTKERSYFVLENGDSYEVIPLNCNSRGICVDMLYADRRGDSSWELIYPLFHGKEHNIIWF